MADPWKLGSVAWCLAVSSWFMAPVISFLVTKFFAHLSIDVERKLKELEIYTIPALKLMLMDVQEKIMETAAKGKGFESDMKTLDKMKKNLKLALYDAEDILDLLDYYRIEKEVIGERSIWLQFVAHCRRSFWKCCRDGRLITEQEISRLEQEKARLQQQMSELNPHIWLQFVARCRRSLWKVYRDTCQDTRLIIYQKISWLEQEKAMFEQQMSELNPQLVPRGTPDQEHPSPDLEAPGNSQEEQPRSNQDAHQSHGAAEFIGNTSDWVQLLRDAAHACIAGCKGRWVGPCTDKTTVARLRLVQQSLYINYRMLFFFLTMENGNLQEQQTSSDEVHSAEVSSDSVVKRLHSWFCCIYSCFRSILCWLANMVAVLKKYRDWSYEMFGIKQNKKAVPIPFFGGNRLIRRMEKIEYILTDSKKSHLLSQQSSSSKIPVTDTNKENSNKKYSLKDRSNKHKVFGRKKDRENICRILREGEAGAATLEATEGKATPSSNTRCYSVICIHGIAGSGKSTLAKYVCEYEEDQGNHFHFVMFIRMTKNFSLSDIFRDMLQKTQHPSSDADTVDVLKNKLNKKLKDKCVLLVLDDLWVNGENEDLDILLSVLDGCDSRSRILVTAQKKDVVADLGVQKHISIPDLPEEVYLSLFMHHALQGAVDADGKFGRIGRKIVNKLHRSPIAAVMVAKMLRGKDIDTWKTTANLDVLNETMGALWWGYQQLGADVRRCFEYCSIFPRGCVFHRDYLVGMWIAQGFLETRNETEKLEDVGQSYIEELLAFSLLQVYRNTPGHKSVIIHDLLHELGERVAGSEFLRIGVSGFDSKKATPQEVRHLFIETYDTAEKNTEKILEFKNLSTLVIQEYNLDECATFAAIQSESGEVEQQYDLVKEKLFEDMFLKMRKLRVLIVIVKHKKNLVFSVPESFGYMKHLRFFSFDSKAGAQSSRLKLILPSTFSKLYHMQTLEFKDIELCHSEDMANFIHLRSTTSASCIANVGRLTSLQSMAGFYVRKDKKGYELKQLKHLNSLRGTLAIRGLLNVRSKEDALEANLSSKTQLAHLAVYFDGCRCNANPAGMQAEVLEGLLPPKDLESLVLHYYTDSRYPSWMLSRQTPDPPMNLDRLVLTKCGHLESIPQGSVFFASLRGLRIIYCTWNALPDHMERLTSLRKLEIYHCNGIEVLPTLPQSLENIRIKGESNLWASFQDETHVNRQRIQHVPCKEFDPPMPNYGKEFKCNGNEEDGMEDNTKSSEATPDDNKAKNDKDKKGGSHTGSKSGTGATQHGSASVAGRDTGAAHDSRSPVNHILMPQSGAGVPAVQFAGELSSVNDAKVAIANNVETDGALARALDRKLERRAKPAPCATEPLDIMHACAQESLAEVVPLDDAAATKPMETDVVSGPKATFSEDSAPLNSEEMERELKRMNQDDEVQSVEVSVEALAAIPEASPVHFSDDEVQSDEVSVEATKNEGNLQRHTLAADLGATTKV